MERRSFIKKATATSLVATGMTGLSYAKGAATTEYYELRTYTMKFGTSRRPLDEYLEQAFIPALNRIGVTNIGVFEEIAAPQPAVLYLLIAYPSAEHFISSSDKLSEDETYQKAKEAYDEVGQAIYSRFDTSLLKAFSGIPQMKVPGKDSGLFELRIYESYSEDAARRKVKMFNEGELDIFYDTGLHPVFFGSCMAGKNMPHLTYMLHFKDMEERDANWKKFVDHPDWKKMSSMDEYANSVSHIIRKFLQRVSYSQV